MTSVVTAAIAVIVIRAAGLNLQRSHAPRYGLRLGLGVLALAAAVLMSRRKPALAGASKPGLVARLAAEPSPRVAFFAGVLMFAPGVTFIAAVQVIATARAGLALTTVGVAVVVIISVMTVWLPLAAYLAAPEFTASKLTALNAWLRAHGRNAGDGRDDDRRPGPCAQRRARARQLAILNVVIRVPYADLERGMAMSRFMRWGLLGAACCLAVAACGSSSSGSGTSPSSSGSGSSAASGSASADSQVCSDVSALSSSVTSLGKISISKDAASQLGDNLSQVKSNLDKLSSDAGSQWSPQVDSLKSALSSAQTAVTSLGSGSGSLSSVVSSVGGVVSAAASLFAAAKDTCP